MTVNSASSVAIPDWLPVGPLTGPVSGAAPRLDTIRDYLLRIVRMDFMPRPVALAMGWFSETMTIGFLPEEFRDKMGIHPSPMQDRVFQAHNAIARRALRVLPRPLKQFPFNLLLADVRWRMRTGRPLV